jgi:hypothetical protein
VRGWIILAATLVIIVWCASCSLWWFVATRDDYARLAVATECFDRGAPPLPSRCARVKRSDIVFYKRTIDRKARNSRLASAGGGAVAVLLLILLNQRINRRARRQA